MIKKLVLLFLGGMMMFGCAGKKNSELLQAAAEGNKEKVALALEKGADINAGDDKRFTALMLSAKSGHLDVVRLLIEKKADLNAKNKSGRTALMVACLLMQESAVRELIAAGADLNIKNKEGEKTALTYAKETGHQGIIKMLEEAGAQE